MSSEKEIIVVPLSEGRYFILYLEFPVGNRAYGGGGWSSKAKHRPAPETRQLLTNDVIFKGKSAIINGVRKLKADIYDRKTGEFLWRSYNLEVPQEYIHPFKEGGILRQIQDKNSTQV
ncbi:MAG: hypothetical protein Q8O88_03715 [bacterium]|nr:hypothetical protein [bacterium]